jgi:cytochrome c oxidase assembly factor CtaG
MLTTVLAHAARPLEPHDVWAAWNLDPLLLGGIGVAVWAYRRGRTPGPRTPAETRRERCFFGALAAVGVALVSPLDALSAALASAHMIQHLLLALLVAPLFALSAPSSRLLRGSPLAVRQAGLRWRRRLGFGPGWRRMLRHPAPVWLLHVGTLWVWHAAVAYDRALGSHLVHVVQHATFLATAVLFWRVIVGPRDAARVSPGLAVLLVFAMGLQSVFLSVLLTFADRPWYSAYASTTAAWGLEHLADQQLAGVIMWVPAGLLYLGAALSLLHVWLGNLEREDLLSSM